MDPKPQPRPVRHRSCAQRTCDEFEEPEDGLELDEGLEGPTLLGVVVRLLRPFCRSTFSSSPSFRPACITSSWNPMSSLISSAVLTPDATKSPGLTCPRPQQLSVASNIAHASGFMPCRLPPSSDIGIGGSMISCASRPPLPFGVIFCTPPLRPHPHRTSGPKLCSSSPHNPTPGLSALLQSLLLAPSLPPCPRLFPPALARALLIAACPSPFWPSQPAFKKAVSGLLCAQTVHH